MKNSAISDLPANLEAKMQAVDYSRVKGMDKLEELCDFQNKQCVPLCYYFHSSINKNMTIQRNAACKFFFFYKGVQRQFLFTYKIMKKNLPILYQGQYKL